MEKMQFTAIVLMTLLTLKLLLLPGKVATTSIMGKARWLMTIGTTLVGAQFLLQYTLGLRALGVTQAVMLNLTLFIPASWLFGMAVLYLQRQGRLNRWDKYAGLLAWAAALLLLGIAAAIDGQPLLSDTPELFWAEVIASACYAVMQGYYTWRHLTNIRAMRHALANYYDRDMDGLLRWMQLSVISMVSMATMVPLLIFMQSIWLAAIGVAVFAGIFYLVDSFCSYVVSSAPSKVQEAEENEEAEALEQVRDSSANPDYTTNIPDSTLLNTETLQHMESVVEQWIERGGHLKNGLKLPNAATDMHVPRYLLSSWLKQTGRRYNDWLTDLRIEEAKHLLETHHDWSNEAIARHCGFSDRTYFQKKFKEKTGLSPAEWSCASD